MKHPRSNGRLHLLLVGLALCAMPRLGAAPETSPPAWEVYQIFEAHCADCHGGHLVKPKGKFGYVLDLPRLSREGLIHPGAPENSDLFTSLTCDDPEEKMPPPDSDARPLSVAQIETIREWIAAGATLDGSVSPAVSAISPHAPTPESHRLAPTRLLGRLHPTLVHFPIALLLGALGAALARRINPSFTWCAGMLRGCLWLGALGALAAALAGWFNARHEGYAQGTVDLHRTLGLTTAGCAMLALVLHEWSVRRPPGEERSRMRRAAAALMLIVAAVLVAWAGHTGGLLAYGEDYLFGR